MVNSNVKLERRLTWWLTIFGAGVWFITTGCSEPLVFHPVIDTRPAPYMVEGELKGELGKAIAGVQITAKSKYLTSKASTDRRGHYLIKVQHEPSEPVTFSFRNAILDASECRTFDSDMVDGIVNFQMDVRGVVSAVP
jgi:hypothetical protein